MLKTFNARLLFAYTDSLVYEIKGKNVYEQCFKDKELFDFSGYSKDSVYYDEFDGVKIIEFIGLKSKMYSLISVDDKEVNKAKGINKNLRHKEYHYVLFNKKVIRHNMKRIQNKSHEIGTYNVFKISLSCFDNKRYVLDNRINTFTYFHKDIVTSSKE